MKETKNKIWRKHDPFGTCLQKAIADESNPFLGMTPTKLEMGERIAGMLDAQAHGRFIRYFDNMDMKFERLNREQERLDYLEGQRRIFQDSPEVAFFDSQLYHIERTLEQREKIARAIMMTLKPTPELLIIWQECKSQPAAFIERVPYLKQMQEGLTQVKQFEFVEEELGLRKPEKPLETETAELIGDKLSVVAPTLSEPKKAGRKSRPPRTFQSFFKGEVEMKRLLAAAESIGLIATDGDKYTWPDEGNKGHRIRAFWYAAEDVGLTKERLKNKEAITKAIQEFFGTESLSKDTIDKENPYNEVYKSTKAALKKKLEGQ